MKKIGLFVLLTVLLCVFAASALAIEGVQLWEDGPAVVNKNWTRNFRNLTTDSHILDCRLE